MSKYKLGVLALILAGVAGCDEAAIEAALAGEEYEPAPDGYKHARDPLPGAVATAMANLRLPRNSIITRDGCYFTYVEPDRPDLVSPLRTAEGAVLCSG